MHEHLQKRNWEDVPALLTIKQFREVAGVSRVMAYELAHREDFPAFRVGRAIKVHRDKAREWLDKQAAKEA